MTLGEKLYELRKKEHLSQEEVAEKLNVTRQTVSKWETDESKPDFDKIVPICELYGISSEELLKGESIEKREEVEEAPKEDTHKKLRAIAITSSIFLYFIAVIWMILAEETLHLEDGLSVSIFMLICGVATCILIFQGIVLSKAKEVPKEDPLRSVWSILGGLFTIIYFVVSFLTMAWHITWLIWIIYAVVQEMIRIIYEMRNQNDK